MPDELEIEIGGESRDEDDLESYSIEDGPETEESFDYDERSANLAADFQMHQEGLDALKSISEEVIRNFDSAWESSEEYRAKRASDWKIFTGDLPPKEFPFEHAANAHAPIMLENITRLQFRAAGELFGDWSNVFGVTPVGPDDDEIAELLSKHGNWQIREKITDFARQQHRGLLMFFLHGDVTCHSYWDPTSRANRHDMLTCDEFVIPYVYTSTQPDYSDIPYYAKVLKYYAHELERMSDTWVGVEEVLEGLAPSWEDEPEQLLRRAAEEVEGIAAPDSDGSAPFKLIQYEGWMKLPNQDRQRFCQVVVDYATKNVLSLTIHEEKSWEDLERYDSQMKELNEYRSKKEQWDGYAVIEQQARQNLEDNPFATPELQAATQSMLGQQPLPPPPQPPAWMEDPSDPEAMPDPVRSVPVRMFSHGVCIEPLAGNLGFGFGRIQADFNRAANVMLSQFIDAATLNNAKGFITTETVEFDRPFSFSPGVINKASGVSGGDLKNNIMPLNVGPASPQLMDGVNLMYQWGQSSIQSPSVLSGEPGKSGETYRGISARIEQATKQLSVATQKYANPFLTQILKNNAKLNAHFLSNEEFFLVNNHQLDPQTGVIRKLSQRMKVGRELYRRNYSVEIRADLKFGTDAARIADADQLVQAAMQIPQLQANNAFVYAAIKKSLEARDHHDMIEKLGPEPPAPTMPIGTPPPAPPGMQGPQGMQGPPGQMPPQ